jgi:hypothetical protein
MESGAQVESIEVQELATRARSFVESFAWCERVTGCSLGFAIAGVLGVFRLELVPAQARGADPTVWVVVGDVPPAYLIFEDGDTWQDALRGYSEEMQRWVDAVRTGESLDDVIPVNVPATEEHADMLASRLKFIRDQLVTVDPASLESDV